MGQHVKPVGDPWVIPRLVMDQHYKLTGDPWAAHETAVYEVYPWATHWRPTCNYGPTLYTHE